MRTAAARVSGCESDNRKRASVTSLKFLGVIADHDPLQHHDLEATITEPAALKIVLSERERGELEARVRRGGIRSLRYGFRWH